MTFPFWLKKNWKYLLFLTILVFSVYANTFGNEFVSDDISGIAQNQFLGNASHLLDKPLSFLRDLFYFIAYKIGGLNPGIFRLINIMLHLGSVWIIFILITLLSNPMMGCFIASIFAIHPLQSEAVTWISAGPYSQYSFFLLLSFLFYIISYREKSRRFFVASILTLLLSLLSTEKGAVFPLILLLFEFSYGNLKSNWKRTLPYWGLSIAWFILFLASGAIGGRVATLQTSYYQEPGLENPFIQIPVAISSYLKLIFIPFDFTLYHSEEMILSVPMYIFRLSVFLLFLAILAVFIKRDKKVFFWLSFFFISLWPVLTPLRISWVVAERYVYLGALGIYVAFAIIVNKLSEKYRTPKLAYYLLIIIVPILSILTIMRNSEWKNQDTLWLATAKTSPSNPQNHNNLGDYYARYGNLPKAIEEFTLATKLKPNYGDAYHNLANTYYQSGKYSQALDNYQKALLYNPGLWQTHQNMAAVYFDLKQYNLAIEHIKKALFINPNYSELHTTLGILLLQVKNKEEAIVEFNKALSLNPQDPRAKLFLLSL